MIACLSRGYRLHRWSRGHPHPRIPRDGSSFIVRQYDRMPMAGQMPGTQTFDEHLL
jgi:hypothetical protein